ncbi:MAG: hypothetical protein H7222_00705 [Methylotenera sp.]|nr:hypothetical protein [Oligoflexia bacterium]
MTNSALAYNWSNLLFPNAYAALPGVSKVTLCFKRLRFKAVEGAETNESEKAGSSDNVDFSPGEITLSSTGDTSIGSVKVPAGSYRRIEFDLEKNCPGAATGNSVQIWSSSNSTATPDFVTQERVTVKFFGTFSAGADGQIVNLGVANILSALTQVATGSDIKLKLEDVSVKGVLAEKK